MMRLSGLIAGGLLAVSGSGDSTARIWDVPTGESLAILGGHHAAVMAAEFTPDGAQVLTLAATPRCGCGACNLGPWGLCSRGTRSS